MIGRLTSKVMSDSEPGIQELREKVFFKKKRNQSKRDTNQTREKRTNDIIGSDEEERGTSRQRGQREHRAVLDELQSQEPEPDQREEEDDKQRMDDGGQPDYRPTALFEDPPIRKDLEKLDQAVYYQQNCCVFFFFFKAKRSVHVSFSGRENEEEGWTQRMISTLATAAFLRNALRTNQATTKMETQQRTILAANDISTSHTKKKTPTHQS
jgi:hypothetical protein